MMRSFTKTEIITTDYRQGNRLLKIASDQAILWPNLPDAEMRVKNFICVSEEEFNRLLEMVFTVDIAKLIDKKSLCIYIEETLKDDEEPEKFWYTVKTYDTIESYFNKEEIENALDGID